MRLRVDFHLLSVVLLNAPEFYSTLAERTRAISPLVEPWAHFRILDRILESRDLDHVGFATSVRLL